MKIYGVYDTRNGCCSDVDYTFTDSSESDRTVLASQLDTPATYDSNNPTYITVKAAAGQYSTKAKF